MTKAKLVSGLGTALMVATLALPVMADNSTSSTSTPRVVPPFNVVCMQTAVDKRDSSVISAWDTLSAAIKSALSARQSDIKTAFGITDKKARKTAIRDAWKTHSKAARDARSAFKSARELAWKTYYADRRACGQAAVSDDSSNKSLDNSL